MIKTINFFSSRCGEIFCEGMMKYSINCSFCSTKGLNYDDFINHFQNIHKNLIDVLIDEAEQELPVAITTNNKNSQTMLKDIDCVGLEKERFYNKVDPKTIVANESKEEQLKSAFENKTEEDGTPLATIKGPVRQNLGDGLKANLNLAAKHTQQDRKSKNKTSKETTKRRLCNRSSNKQNEELKCPICDIYKNNKYNLQSHINSHTGARPYNCQQCGNNFTNSGNLWKHIELVHKGIRTHECAKCKKKFQYKSQVKRHEMRVHLKVRPYPCDSCDSSYCTKKELIDHRRKHLSIETEATVDGVELESSFAVVQDKQHGYVCEHCGKSFAKYSGIWAHRRLHSEEKRYICNVCNKPMHTSYHLKEHMNTHTGERPHKCEVCGKAFQQKKFLRDHSRIHEVVKAFACKLCDKKFSQAAGLYCHSKTHKEL